MQRELHGLAKGEGTGGNSRIQPTKKRRAPGLSNGYLACK